MESIFGMRDIKSTTGKPYLMELPNSPYAFLSIKSCNIYDYPKVCAPIINV